MTAKKWITQIKKKMAIVGVKYEGFENVVKTLSELLEERDRVYEQYQDEGSHPLIEYVSDRGKSNMVTNPLLKEWQQMNRDALTYWKELGLTPAGLKKLNEEGVNAQDKRSALDKVLANLEM